MNKHENIMENLTTIHYASASFNGHGHQLITVELEMDGAYNEFKAITNNMPNFDLAMDLDGQEKYNALFSIIEYKIEDQIEEWVIELNA